MREFCFSTATSIMFAPSLLTPCNQALVLTTFRATSQCCLRLALFSAHARYLSAGCHWTQQPLRSHSWRRHYAQLGIRETTSGNLYWRLCSACARETSSVYIPSGCMHVRFCVSMHPGIVS